MPTLPVPLGVISICLFPPASVCSFKLEAPALFSIVSALSIPLKVRTLVEPVAANISPTTCSLDPGLVVPIPTLPLDKIFRLEALSPTF